MSYILEIWSLPDPKTRQTTMLVNKEFMTEREAREFAYSFQRDPKSPRGSAEVYHS